jgi:hypothetical protein
VSDPPETQLPIARRHVREGEKRVVRVALLIDEMDEEKHPKAAVLARVVLDTMRTSLEFWRRRLIRIESRMKRRKVQPGLGMS